MATVYLIPTFLYENAVETIPAYVLEAVKNCQVFYVENERTARRFLKQLWREMVIDDYEWHAIHKAENEVQKQFVRNLQAGKNVGIISEAGCPALPTPGKYWLLRRKKLAQVLSHWWVRAVFCLR